MTTFAEDVAAAELEDTTGNALAFINELLFTMGRDSIESFPE